MKLRVAIVISVFLCSLAFTANANVLMSPKSFLQEMGLDGVKPRTYWVSAETQKQAQKILNHPYKGLRVRYWTDDKRSAWVLNEIGKEQPITFGVVINAGRVESIRVLVFREVRGDEIKSPQFTAQFDQAVLTDDFQLDRRIDGITGATYSVRSMKKVARLALLFHSAVLSK